MKTDPEYKARVERVLALYYEGSTLEEIAQIEGMGSNAAVSKMITKYADMTIAPPRDIETELRDQKIAAMHAVGISNFEIARALNTRTKVIEVSLSRMSGPVLDAFRDWKETTLETGFAVREFRIWTMNKDLLWLEEEIPEIEKVFTKTPEGVRTYESLPTGRTIPRKFEKDQYGRPIWGQFRAKLFDELGKLKGDHSMTLNLGLINPETRSILDQLNMAHRAALPAPVEAQWKVEEEPDAATPAG